MPTPVDEEQPKADPARVTERFHPVVRRWFERRFPHGPTNAQSSGWPSIHAGQDTLIAAPTGSGKTLAAFLVHIDRLYREAERGALPNGIDVVYVSPLKALVADIHENLERPLSELFQLAAELGCSAPELRVAMRSGDTPASKRARQLRTPPHFLITTPESLFLMVTAEKSRRLLTSVKSIIVDEIHSLARDKRGSHLALTLERLTALCKHPPQRIGLSATQRPLPAIAELLVGKPGGKSGPCTIIDQGHQRNLELALTLPNRELDAVASTEQLGEMLDDVAAQVKQHETTLIFVNTRRLAERLAHMLSERLGDARVAAHHGSLSKERRLRTETQLKNGELRALVATASLELGIDVGPVELVCQIGSPRSIATFLQRVGRSGHTRFGTPRGRLYPLTRDELVECAALLRAVSQGRLDSVLIPRAPEDVLAQQIIAECSAQDWDEDALYRMLTRAAPFADVSRNDFDRLVELVSEGIVTGRGKRAAYVHRDKLHGRLSSRKGARWAALTSGGAIPDNADYRVVQEPDETFVGTINEDFAIESMAGDVFLLGSTSWRIRRVQPGLVRVEDAKGAHPNIPFWLGEAPARTRELSEEVSALRRAIDGKLETDGCDGAVALVAESCRIEPDVARVLVEYMNAARCALGVLPTMQDIVVERFFDETSGMQLVVHSPFGGRINRSLGLLLRKRFCRSFDFELQAAANDDAIVLSLGPQHSFPLEDLRDFLSPRGIEDALRHAVLVTPMFQARWRWNLNRFLVVLRQRGGKKNPAQLQRMEADDVMAAVFPSLAACQDNATGPREIPDHPIVQQTLSDCLTEAMDAKGLSALLEGLQRGELRIHFRDTTEPSLLTHEILNARPYAFLDDAPLEERRTRAVQLRRGLPLEARDLSALDPEAVRRVAREARRELDTPDRLHDHLSEIIVQRPLETWRAQFDVLRDDGRAREVNLGDGRFWLSWEREAEFAALFPETAGDRVTRARGQDSVPDLDEEALVTQVVRVHLEQRGPTTLEQLCDDTALDGARVRAALARLEHDGFAFRGHFDATLGPEQFCTRRLLGRIHNYTQARLRAEIEPVTAQDFMRFLLDFQGVTRESRRRGAGGLMRTVAQLQGFEAAAAVWESDLLKVRIAHFEEDQLDGLCWSGGVMWGRLSPRAVNKDEQWANFSRATPITLLSREDFPWLSRALSGKGVSHRPSAGALAALLEVLDMRGALFFSELLDATGSPADELEETLWDGVARGFLTSDGFVALRSLLAPKRRSHTAPRHARFGSLRRGTTQPHSRNGRWARLPVAEETPDEDALSEAVAEQLLARYGVVFRDLVKRESFTVPWRNVVWAFRRLEARGQIRGGRFVKGYSGEQFALPEAVDALRRVRRTPPTGEIVTLSACDPLNLVGTVLPGKRVAAQRSREVRLQDGVVLQEDAPLELRA